MSNTMFSHQAGHPHKLHIMEKAFDRMILAAFEIKKWNGPAEVARKLGKSDQVLTNWKSRGIPRAEIMDIADAIGCRAHWLRDGTGTMISQDMSEISKMLEENPELIRLLKVAAPLGKYQVDVLVTTSTALAEQPKKGNGAQ